MYSDGGLNAWDKENDLFREDYFLVPHEEEIRARAEQVRQDNRDALRHFVELAIWGALDQPDHLKVLITLLWHWKDVDPKWMAESSFMSASDVRDVAESQPVIAFPCLGCGVELTVFNRLHRVRLQRSIEDYCSDMEGNEPPAGLFCRICQEQENDVTENQRRLDRERYEAIIAEYRARPYAERRKTKEWARLKHRILRRDKYRCRMCGRDDLELHIHHCTYENYAQEKLEDLITLCSECHHDFHFRSEAS